MYERKSQNSSETRFYSLKNSSLEFLSVNFLEF